MEKTDWSQSTRDVVEPLLEPGEELLLMGTVEYAGTNTGDRLFTGLPEDKYMTKSAHVVMTSARVMFVRTSINANQFHTGVSVAPWGALTEVANPKPLLSGQLRYLNFIFPSGVNRFRPGDGGVKTQFFDALVAVDKSVHTDPDGRQKAFYDRAAAIAQERVKAAHDAGQTPNGELLTTVLLPPRPLPGRAPKAAKAASGPKAPSKGRWLPILLWVLAAGALGFGAFCFIHLLDQQDYLATGPRDYAASTAEKVALLTKLTLASAGGGALFIALGVWAWVRGSRRVRNAESPSA